MKKDGNDMEQTVIIGRNAVLEALRSGREADKLFVAHGSGGGPVQAIIAKCVQKKILIKEVPAVKLDFLSGGGNHQGVILMVAAHSYASVEDILARADERGEKPFVLICDGIEDPHNLGAVIRTAEAAGVHGVIIPKHRAATLTASVAKAACGALEYVPVAKVTNLADTMDKLKEKGLWIYGAEMSESHWCQTDFTGAIALVIGSEGYGISALIKKKCDGFVSMPMLGRINSLNASVAAGVLMYEAARQRLGIAAIANK